jgi:hypothetical protein
MEVKYIPLKKIRDEIAIEMRPQEQAYLTLLLAFAQGHLARPASLAQTIVDHQTVVDHPDSMLEYAKRALSIIFPVTTQFEALLREKVRIRLYLGAAGA